MASRGCPSSASEKDKLSRATKSEACPRALHGDKLCPLPTWWFWRGGCTRSHSEPGRETPQRRWYFVSRRGRVGRRQVCKRQSILFDDPAETAKKAGRKAALLP